MTSQRQIKQIGALNATLVHVRRASVVATAVLVFHLCEFRGDTACHPVLGGVCTNMNTSSLACARVATPASNAAAGGHLRKRVETAHGISSTAASKAIIQNTYAKKGSGAGYMHSTLDLNEASLRGCLVACVRTLLCLRSRRGQIPCATLVHGGVSAGSPTLRNAPDDGL